MSTKKFNNLKNATGTIIKRAREEKKMSKKDLSKELELCGVYINRDELLLIEKNQLLVKDFELIAISKILDIDLNNLKKLFKCIPVRGIMLTMGGDVYMTIKTKENPKILNDFLMYLYIIKGYSQNTISTYNFNILHFLKFLLQYWDIPIKTKDVTIFILINVKESDIAAYLVYLNYLKDNSPSTRKNKIESLRSFYKWIFSSFPTNTNMKENPMLSLPGIQQQIRLPKYLNLKDAYKIQNIFNISNSRFYIRDNLIITLFLQTGMRLSELVNININNINFDKKSITIIGKNNKERIIYLNDLCMKKLKEYINLRKNKTKIININEALFLNKNGQRLQQHGVEYICKKAFKLAGLEEYNYTTHSLRHTVATQLYINDIDLLVIKEILGHSSITTTEIYTHVHNLKVKEAVEKNPLSNFGLILEEGKGVAV